MMMQQLPISTGPFTTHQNRVLEQQAWIIIHFKFILLLQLGLTSSSSSAVSTSLQGPFPLTGGHLGH